MSFNSPFTGNVIVPTDVSYRSITLSANTTLEWPINGNATPNYAARIMNVTASSGGLVLRMPPANQASVGQDALIRNVGANSFTVADYDGNVIVAVAASEAKYIYITANPDEAGTWGVIAFGVGSSAADAGSLDGLGLTVIGSTLNTAHPVQTISSGYTAVAGDRAKTYVWTGGAGTLTLTSSVTLGDNWFMLLRNGGTGTLTVSPSGGDLIDGSATITLQPADSAIICCSGAAFFTVGIGKSADFNFTQNTKAVVSGAYTLSASEAANPIQKFTGTLSGNVTVTVPQTIAVYYITNQTDGTGAGYTVTFTTGASGSASATVPAGQQVILLCDSLNLYNASTIAAGASNISLADGSVSTPSLNFATELTTGVYRPGSAEWAVTVLGVQRLLMSATGATITGSLSVSGNAAVGGTTTLAALTASGNVSLDGGTFVFNESGADKDARFEGDNDPNLLFLDASTDRVGIGTASPTDAKVVIEGPASAPSVFNALALRNSLDGSVALIFDNSAATTLASIEALITSTGAGTDDGVLAFGTALNGVNAERMRLDASGNLGIGTASPAFKLDVEGSQRIRKTGAGYNAEMLSFSTITETGAVYRMGMATGGVFTIGRSDVPRTDLTLDTNGNLLVGTAGESPSATSFDRLQINAPTSSGRCAIRMGLNDARGGAIIKDQGTFDLELVTQLNSSTNTGNLIFKNNPVTENARFTSSGALLLGTTDGNLSSGVGYKFAVGGSWGVVINQASTYNSFHYYNENAINNGYRFYVQADGGVANYSGNNVNLSDARVKTDIKPAPSYWNLIKAIEIVTFKYKDQDHSGDTIGVIAQQVERVAPELVDNRGFGETPEDGTPLKAVFSNDMYHAAIGALQEAMRRIETLEAKVAALEAAC